MIPYFKALRYHDEDALRKLIVLTNIVPLNQMHWAALNHIRPGRPTGGLRLVLLSVDVLGSCGWERLRQEPVNPGDNLLTGPEEHREIMAQRDQDGRGTGQGDVL